MKKKLVAFALAAVCAAGCAVGLSACNKGGGNGGDNGGTATELTAEEWTAATTEFSTGANFSMEMYSGEVQAFGAKIQQTTFYQFYYEETTKCEDIYTVTGLETQSPVFYLYSKEGDGDWTRYTTDSTSYTNQLSSNVGIPISVVPNLDRNDFTVEGGKYKAASITLQGATVTNVELTFNSNKKLSLITCDYSGYGGLHIVINNIGSTSVTVPQISTVYEVSESEWTANLNSTRNCTLTRVSEGKTYVYKFDGISLSCTYNGEDSWIYTKVDESTYVKYTYNNSEWKKSNSTKTQYNDYLGSTLAGWQGFFINGYSSFTYANKKYTCLDYVSNSNTFDAELIFEDGALKSLIFTLKSGNMTPYINNTFTYSDFGTTRVEIPLKFTENA